MTRIRLAGTLRAILLSVTIGAAAVLTPLLVPAVDASRAPLPACNGVYKDASTPFRSYTDWSRTLVDTIYAVPSSYYPGDLVGTGMAGGGSVRRLVRPDLLAMANAAARAGAPLQVASAFRSYATQVSTFNFWVRTQGSAAALGSSARPGHSEHQLGTAIDFTSRYGAAPWNYADWATTRAGAWMLANAYRYGFVESYPRSVSPSMTCYIYEPWHYRYVGKAEALAIHNAKTTPRQYLWALQP